MKLPYRSRSPISLLIAADILQDHGIETVRLYELERSPEPHSRFTVPASQFPALTGAAEQLGAHAIVEPGQGLKERTRVAIQTLSTEIITPPNTPTPVGARSGMGGSTSTAWSHPGRGSRDRCGGYPQPRPGPLPPPHPPVGDEFIAAVRASSPLDLLPFHVAVPLLAAAYLAPLGELFAAEPPDFVLWLHGPSGTFKSQKAARAEPFRRFPRQHLPASFAATANAIERPPATTKDALLVVDDYHPASDAREAAAMAQVASRLLPGWE